MEERESRQAVNLYLDQNRTPTIFYEYYYQAKVDISTVNTESSNATTDDGLPPDDPPLGPSLGEILGLVALVITILYIIGISWKVMKIYKGEYVPTEPVYLKYK